MIKERRKHPRLRIPLEAEYLVAGRQEWREGTIWTLGAGGAALLCDEKLERGTQLDGLHFIVEKEGDLPETRIEVGAEVVSLDRKSDFGRPSNFMLGLRFTDLGEQEFELLRQFVFRRLTEHKNGQHGGEEDEEPRKEGSPPIEIRFKLFDEFVEEVSENLSPSGMFIRAHRPLPPGSRFVFQFQLGDDFSLFQGTAEVVWTRRRAEGPDRLAGMGVRFLKLDLTSQKMVRRLVSQRQEEGEHAAGADRGDAVETAAGPPPLRLSEEAEPFAIGGEPPAEAEGGREARERDSADRQAELELRLTGLEERLAEARAAHDEALEQAARLEDEAEALREENQALESSRDEAQEARGRAEAEAADLLAELEALRPDGEAEEMLQQASAELEHGRETWRALEAELREDLERQRAVEAELREALDEAGRTEERLRQGLEEAGEATADLQQRVQRGNETEAELRQRLEQAEAGSEELDKQTERAAAAESDLERQRQEAAGAKRGWDAIEADLRSQLEARSAAEAELEERLTEATGVEAELRQRLSELRGSREELEQQLAEGTEIEAALREQAQELRASRDALEAELGQTRRQLDRMRGAAEEMRSRFNGDLSAAQALESDLASRLAQVAEVGSSLEEKVADLTTTRADLAERLARITGAWCSLEEGLAAVVAESNEEMEEPAPVLEPVAATEPQPPAVELAEEPAMESAGEEPVAETLGEEPPAPKEKRGLVSAARRAAARLGFGRKPAGDDEQSADEGASLLEARTEPVVVEDGGGPSEIEETVRAWAAAWSEQRVEDYLSFYSQEFEPTRPEATGDSDEAPHAWLPPLAGMELTLGPISQTELAPGRFAVRFEQSVESDSYTRRTGRTLEFVREADAWKIAAESFQEL